jgi:hypothetical protein
MEKRKGNLTSVTPRQQRQINPEALRMDVAPMKTKHLQR